MKRTLRIGLTGGIGSGKSTVTALLRLLGVPCYDADSRAKALMTEEADLRAAITGLFGPQAYASDGSLQRATLAAEVFGHPERLGQLNAAVHPAVARDFNRWAADQRAAYVVEEAAVLIEAGASRTMDRVVVVTAPLELRIERVMARDGLSEAEALARVGAQLSESQRLAAADYVLVADDEQLLIPQVVSLNQELIRLAESEKI